MVITIHQPEHMPWVGFFNKMIQADTYVYLDNVQFKTGNFQNRNKILNHDYCPLWLTVPTEKARHLETTLDAIRIGSVQNWRQKYWGRIYDSYCKHPYFGMYNEALKAIIFSERTKLIDLNLALIDFLRDILEITVPTVRSSILGVRGTATERLVNICQALRADTYISGPDGRNYLDLSLFDQAGIRVTYHDFSQKPYPSAHFQPYLSTLDLIMNHGPSSRSYI